MSRIKIIIDLARSPHVKLSDKEAMELLECILSHHGETRDLSEAMRIIANFDEFYNMARKKFEEYLFIPKDSRDAILGRVVVHKIKLEKNNDRNAEIIFDRRFDLDLLKKCLEEIGFSEIEVERQIF